MAGSIQSRFERLFPNRSTPSKRASDDLTFAEKELLEYKDRQSKSNAIKKMSNSSLVEHNLPAEAQNPEHAQTVSSHTSAIIGDKQHSPSLQQLTAGPSLDKVLYLPNRPHQKGLAVTTTETDYDDDREPASSSEQTVGTFCVFPLVAKFPYKYMQDPNDQVSRSFFASGKIYQRNWNMYFIFGPHSTGVKPLMLVPVDQVRQLVDEISSEFRIDAQVPPYPFQLSFYNDSTPSPQLLGTVNSKAEMERLQLQISYPSVTDGQLGPNATVTQQRDFEAWQEKVERAFEATKNRKNDKDHKGGHARALGIQESANQLKAAQRYLGTKPKPPSTQTVQPCSISEQQQLGSIANNTLHSDIFDVNKATPHPFEDETVIIAIDLESWERDHNIITEIGVSTLDTADLVDLPPGYEAEEWIKKIRSRHFRLEGRENLRNVDFVHGCPEMFQFGVSEFVSLDKAVKAVDSCFEHPYSAGFECEGPPDIDERGLPVQRATATLDSTLQSADDPRNLLLVGHDIKSDIAYLSTLGSAIFGFQPSDPNVDSTPSRRQRVLNSIRDVLDTATLYQSLTRTKQPRSLVKICSDLGITTWHPHNAGNDARYTLEAFLKIVIKARQEDDHPVAGSRQTGVVDHEKNVSENQSMNPISTKCDTDRAGLEATVDVGEKATIDGTSHTQFEEDDDYPY